MKKIVNIASQKKMLEFMKYNKKFQKRINLDINDYKKYSQLYSSIEIELELTNNRSTKIINISDEYKKYITVFRNKKEIKRKNMYLNKDENKNNLIKIKIDYHVKSFKYLFAECKFIKKINFIKFYRNNIGDMKGMFKKCISLEYLNLSNFNTERVMDMSFMFSGCLSLKELDLSSFNTELVVNMDHMFYECSSLTSLNLSNFNTYDVINMNSMFCECSSLKELNIANFNTENVFDLDYMFAYCRSLENLIIYTLKIDKLNQINGIYLNCKDKIKNEIKFLIHSN